jgi:hypothetical protein
VLLTKAKKTYPEVRARLVSQQSEAGSDSLRGLAAAANALQPEDAHHEPNMIGHPPSVTSTTTHPPLAEDAMVFPPTPVSAVNNTPMFSNHGDSDAKLLPRYVVKSIGPDGWREIRNADDWYSVLREKAFAIWADGVCNVLVELADVPGVSA